MGRNQLKVATLLVIAATVTMSCSGAATSPSAAAPSGPPTGEITFTGGVDTPGFYASMATKYEASHPNTKINVIEQSWTDIDNKLKTDFAAGGYNYDVVMDATNALPQFANAGWVDPLTDAQVAEISPDNISMSIGQFGGKQVAVPFTAYPQLWVANTDLLAKAGVAIPKTWDDVTNDCLALQKVGVPYCMLLSLKAGGGGYAANGVQDFAYAFGGKLMDNGKPVWNTDPLTLQSMQWVGVVTAFDAGRYAFEVTSAWGFFQAAQNDTASTVKGKVQTFLTPTTASGAGGGTFSYGAVLFIPATAKNKALAWDFEKFLVSDQGQKELLTQTGNVPVYAHLYSDTSITSTLPGMPIIGQMIAKGTSTLPYTWELQWEDVMTPLIQQAWTAKMPVQDALNQAASQCTSFDTTP
jgi:multiple sugar transport system substrate-binding protein